MKREHEAQEAKGLRIMMRLKKKMTTMFKVIKCKNMYPVRGMNRVMSNPRLRTYANECFNNWSDMKVASLNASLEDKTSL